ncbi:MAG TPA: hypothetical protein VHW90_14215 [Stellaceae bacterium]|nr:hypothetical protein [Stellaceae bacterium]
MLDGFGVGRAGRGELRLGGRGGGAGGQATGGFGQFRRRGWALAGGAVGQPGGDLGVVRFAQFCDPHAQRRVIRCIASCLLFLKRGNLPLTVFDRLTGRGQPLSGGGEGGLRRADRRLGNEGESGRLRVQAHVSLSLWCVKRNI